MLESAIPLFRGVTSVYLGHLGHYKPASPPNPSPRIPLTSFGEWSYPRGAKKFRVAVCRNSAKIAFSPWYCIPRKNESRVSSATLRAAEAVRQEVERQLNASFGFDSNLAARTIQRLGVDKRMHWLLMILRWLAERLRLGTAVVRVLQVRMPVPSIRGGVWLDYRPWEIPGVGKMKVCRVLKFSDAPPGRYLSGAPLTVHRERDGLQKLPFSSWE